MDPNNEPVIINMKITGTSFPRSRSLDILRYSSDIKIYKENTKIHISKSPNKRKVIFETLLPLVNNLTYFEDHPSMPLSGRASKSRLITFNSPPTLCLGQKYKKGNSTIRVFKKDGKRLGTVRSDNKAWNIVLVTVVIVLILVVVMLLV